MADPGPDYQVEQARLASDIDQLKATQARQRLAILEHEREIQRTIENLRATAEAIAEKENQLKGLTKEHGKLAIDWDAKLGELREDGNG